MRQMQLRQNEAAFSLKAGDNVGSAWDKYLTEAISDWNPSNMLDLREGGRRYDGHALPAHAEPTYVRCSSVHPSASIAALIARARSCAASSAANTSE